VVTPPRIQRRGVAGTFAVAWIICPLIEPDPNGPNPVMQWWLAAVNVAAIAAICVAVVALWIGVRRAPALGVVAGVGMVVETVLCPGSGHHTVGWWTWTQGVLSLGVLATSIVLVSLDRGATISVDPSPVGPDDVTPEPDRLPAAIAAPRDDLRMLVVPSSLRTGRHRAPAP